MFGIEYFLEINQPFSINPDNMHCSSVFAESVGIRIGGQGIIDRPDADGKNACFTILLAGLAVHLLKTLLPFTDQQEIDRITEQVKPGFLIIAVQGCADKLTSGILCIFRLIECLSSMAGGYENEETKGYDGFQWKIIL